MRRWRDMAGNMGIRPRNDAKKHLANDLVAAIGHHQGRAYRFGY